MNLSNLTTSGWVLFAWTCICAVGFVVSVLTLVSLRSDRARLAIVRNLVGSTILLVVQVLWLRWLLT